MEKYATSEFSLRAKVTRVKRTVRAKNFYIALHYSVMRHKFILKIFKQRQKIFSRALFLRHKNFRASANG